MALTECGGKVSTRVEVCPHCECPVEPPTPQINCPDCGGDFAGSLAPCPVCGGPAVVPESSEELSEPLEAEPISSEHELYEEYSPMGQLREKGFKLDGEWDGPYEYYYANGQLESKGIYESGKRCGEWIENGNPKIYPPCSGEKAIKRAPQLSQQASAGGSGQVSSEGAGADPREPESVATTDEPFNNFVALAVGAFVFQIARTLGLNFGALTAIFGVIPWVLLVRYGKKQSPQGYAGIIALCFAVLVIAVIGN